MPAVMGVETEYGILAPQRPDLDPHHLSAGVVAAWDGPATRTTLDFDDPLPIEDLHNRILGNGARFYVDHAHPEYSGPEITSAAAGVSYDLAGDRIVAAAAALAGERLGTPVRIFKNNTDSQGASYGCHENYLLARATPWDRIVRGFTGFLVTRALVSGAGRVGVGQNGQQPGFQLTQRADFFETAEGIETTRRRPIINTRDEPHARPAVYRRLHVITGDANRSGWSTWLKLGAAAAVLAALEADALPEFSLADPVAAMRSVSHDPWQPIELADGRRVTAAELQGEYLAAALAHAERQGGDLAVLQAWQQVLTDFGSDPALLADRLDWAAKRRLLVSYADRHGLSVDSPRLAQLDLAWAELGERSPFEALLRRGAFRPLPFEPDVEQAVRQPPSDTRAWLRGTIVQRRAEAVAAGSWDWLVLRGRHGRRTRLDLSDPLSPGDPDAVLAALAR